MARKYLIIGGEVQSSTDGQVHYVNAHRLRELYGVLPHECILAESNIPESLRGIHAEAYIVLRPRYDGNYELS